MADISAIPQNQLLGRLAGFLRFLEKDRPEFLPSELGAMQAASKLMLPQASTVENLSYGNLPFTMPPSGTGAMIPQVKTGRKAEVADLVGMITGGVPGAKTVAGVGTNLSNKAADELVRMITRNPQATAPAVLQETAMPFMNAIAPRQPGLLSSQKSELGFYSALEQATMPLQNKGTGAQFLAQIEKTAGVKPEEVKWTGLDEFLKSRQNVTKQEVQDYLAANRVNLQEVRLGTPEAINRSSKYATPEVLRIVSQHQGSADNAALLALDNDYAAYKEITTKFPELRNNPDWAETVLNDVTGTTGNLANLPKFSQYTLPGGENYREILLTLPSGPRQTKFEVFDPSTQRAIPFETREEAVAFAGKDQTRSSVVAEVDVSKPDYRSGHYRDQPNIFAHMRVNDRVVDGKKTLFIEEIQSDWHQAGRKKGYGPQTETTHEAYYTTPDGQRVSLGFGKTQEEAAAAVDPGWQGIVDVKFDTQTKKVGEGVPDAPFKTSWHELTLKRAIQEASEKGYDQIAFTTGKTQAERYDLSKQVSTLRAPYDNGEYVVSYIPKGGNDYEYMGRFLEKDLPNAVGKDLAEKIIANKGIQTMTYKGDDLRVGGEGMKGFYDQILPKSLEKLGKKFDAKVGKTEMDGVEVWQMDITPKMRESVLTKGQPLFAATPVLPAGLLGRDEEE